MARHAADSIKVELCSEEIRIYGEQRAQRQAWEVMTTPGTSRVAVIRTTSFFVTPAHEEADDQGTIFKWPERPYLTMVKL